MDIRLHPAGARPGKTRRPGPDGWRAGLPVKRFFTRFRSLADVPPEDLVVLSERIRLAMDVSQEANIAALHAAVRTELRNRETEPDD
ncbi:hypothetical protein [Arthrobacter sp. Soil762]|uniref:hypothetical protein n=1 Tax=Arthrobacter sp. Soil762 TaxID=1736401 RepID=UPI0009E9FF88|nr:hypothetical protein [Arthrobacter sp. Soil762]